MAQIRAKQIKLVAAGDLLVGGTSGNGSVLSVGTEAQVLKVVGGALTYIKQAASDVTFAAGESGLVSTDVNAAVIEVAAQAAAAASAASAASDASAAETIRAEGVEAGIITGAGLTTGTGVYIANGSANYIAGATSLVSADNLLDAELKTVADSVAASSTTVTNIIAAAGLNTDGTFVPFTGTNYLDATSTIAGGLAALDTQLFTTTSGLASEVTRATAAEGALTTRINNLDVTLGFASGTDAYAAPTGTNYLGAATSFVNADVLLDTAIKAEVTRATGAEILLDTGITTEQTRATGAEIALGTRITNLTATNIAFDDTTSALGATTVQGAIDAVVTKVNSLAGAFEYKGTVDASVSGNLPVSPRVGDYYKVVVAGTFGGTAGFPQLQIGDAIVFNGGTSGSAGENWDVLAHVDSTVTGTSGQIAVSGTIDTGFVVAIDAAYIGQASITTLGTVTTGTWNGAAIDLAHGGTGADLSAAADNSLLFKSGSSVAAVSAPTTASTFLSWNGTAFVWAAAAAASVANEDFIPTGSDFTNFAVTVANTPVTGSVEVYINGLRLRNTGFTVAGSVVTLVDSVNGYAVDASDVIDVHYNFAA